MSFIGIVEGDLDEAAQVALTAAKTTINYIDNVIVQDIEPALLAALQSAIAKLGSEAVTAVLTVTGLSSPTPPVS